MLPGIFKPGLDLTSAATRAGVTRAVLLRAVLAGDIEVKVAPSQVDAWVARGKPVRTQRRWKKGR